MEQQSLYYIVTLLSAIFVGILCGIAPLITGFVKKDIKSGVKGFAACIIGGFVLGIILAIPIAVIFTVWILKNNRDTGDFAEPPPPPSFSE